MGIRVSASSGILKSGEMPSVLLAIDFKAVNKAFNGRRPILPPWKHPGRRRHAEGGDGFGTYFAHAFAWRNIMPQSTAGRRAPQQIQTQARCQPIGLDRNPNVRSSADPDAGLVKAIKSRTACA